MTSPRSFPPRLTTPPPLRTIAPRPSGPPPAPQYLTVLEITKHLRVSKMTVYRLVHGGDLDSVRVGRSIRVPRESLDQYLTRSEVGAA